MLSANTQNQEKSKFTLPPRRLASGGNDNKIKVWEFKESDQKPTEHLIGQHDDWVRDVAWCDSIGLAYDMIASCSEDKTCKVWRHDKKTKQEWSETSKITFKEQVPLWKVSWS